MEQAQANSNKKVVIVEDDKDLAEIYKTRVESQGYTSFVASDGIAALYIIQKEVPDLVLLDLMVPNIAGDEILKRMRSSDWGKNIPVVIISNLSEEDAPAGLRDLGISGYAVKANLSLDQLDQLVNAMVQNPRQNPTPSPPPAASGPSPTPPTTAGPAPAPPNPQGPAPAP